MLFFKLLIVCDIHDTYAAMHVYGIQEDQWYKGCKIFFSTAKEHEIHETAVSFFPPIVLHLLVNVEKMLRQD